MRKSIILILASTACAIQLSTLPAAGKGRRHHRTDRVRPIRPSPRRHRHLYGEPGLAELDLDQSFSAVGSCYDNAAVASFFATVKRELAWIHHRSAWPTRAALRTALFDYIEGFYNAERIQQRLTTEAP